MSLKGKIKNPNTQFSNWSVVKYLKLDAIYDGNVKVRSLQKGQSNHRRKSQVVWVSRRSSSIQIINDGSVVSNIDSQYFRYKDEEVGKERVALAYSSRNFEEKRCKAFVHQTAQCVIVKSANPCHKRCPKIKTFKCLSQKFPLSWIESFLMQSLLPPIRSWQSV